MLWVVKSFFHDKRLTTTLLLTWMTTTCCIFYGLGAFHSQFMTFGPSDSTVFMAMKIDTWGKWYALATFSLLNTTINEFIGSAMGPWFTNTIQDQKTRYLDHSKLECMAISLMYDIYTHVMSIFSLYLMFSQIDFLLIRMMADVTVTVFTTMEWMRNKVVDKGRHDREWVGSAPGEGGPHADPEDGGGKEMVAVENDHLLPPPARGGSCSMPGAPSTLLSPLLQGHRSASPPPSAGRAEPKEVVLDVVQEEREQRAAWRSTCAMLGCLAGMVVMGLWYQLVVTGYYMDENRVSTDVVFDLVPLDRPVRLRSMQSTSNITDAQRERVLAEVQGSATVQQGKLRGLEAEKGAHYSDAIHQRTVTFQREARANMLAWSVLRRLAAIPGSIHWFFQYGRGLGAQP